MPPSAGLSSPWWRAINYAARAMVLVAGLVLALGLVPLPPHSEVLVRTFGIVMALFGLYRLVWYHSQLRQQQRNEEDA